MIRLDIKVITRKHGRQRAIEMVWGRFSDSYRDLFNYLHRLKIVNPNSLVNLKANSNR